MGRSSPFPGNGETKEFDENSVTDLRALCYYTQTDLFSGEDSQIQDIDGFNCVPAEPDGNELQRLYPLPRSFRWG